MRDGVARTSLHLAALAIFARAAGFAVPIVIAGWFGVRLETDAFYYALGVPAFLVVLGNSAVATLLVPALSERRAHAPETFGPLGATAAVLTTAGALAIGVGAAVLLPVVLPWVSGFDAVGRATAARYAWSLAPYQGLVGGAAALRAVLEVGGGYRISAISPLLRAGTQLLVTGFLLSFGPAILPFGILAGSVVELLWIGVAIHRRGVSLRPSRALVSAVAASQVGFWAVAAGEGLVALQVVVDKAFASGLGTGAVSVLEYADRVRLIPQTLLEASLVVVAYNEWARLDAEAQPVLRRAAIARSLTWVGLLAPPVLAAMYVVRLALVRLLFEHGALDPSWSPAIADALGAFLPGVFFSLVGSLVVKAQILAGRRRLVLGLGIGSFVANAALDAALAPHLGVVGLTLSTTLVTTAVTLVSTVLLRPELRARDLGSVALVAAVAVGLGAVVGRPDAVPTLTFWTTLLPFGALFVGAALVARRR